MEKTRILVWDLPLRVFHWLLAASFAGAFLTAESERFRDLHAALGYTVGGLLVFRLAWAFAGTRYARLSSFAFGPAAVWGYLKSLLQGKPLHYVGHNPAGSWVIYALLLLGVAVGISGHAVYAEAGGHWLKELHEGLANAMLGLVIVHVVGVVVSSFLHRENLALAMVTGYKRGQPDAAIRRTHWATAVALVLAVGMLWSAVPNVPVAVRQHEATPHGQEHAPALREARRHERGES
ncbi:MAG TPA: cytochrome b/b6 domain-containing protein [Casimicrobiaceae bacterium]